MPGNGARRLSRVLEQYAQRIRDNWLGDRDPLEAVPRSDVLGARDFLSMFVRASRLINRRRRRSIWPHTRGQFDRFLSSDSDRLPDRS